MWYGKKEDNLYYDDGGIGITQVANRLDSAFISHYFYIYTN